jgi:uncharacterized membrane protein YqaE (UPF0057 family)
MKKVLHLGLVLLLAVCTISPSLAINVMPSGSDGATTPKDTAATMSKEKFDEAMKEFKSLSRHDRKARIKDAKKAWKQYKADKRAGRADGNTNTLLLVIIAILLPPLAVFLHQGEINGKFWIDLILTLLFYLPGLIYALVVILGNNG